jgi:plasmid replication initiation protein
MEKKTKKVVRKSPGMNLELKKPSQLCQVLFYKDFNKEEYANLTPLQIDIINVTFRFISDIMEKQDLTREELFEWANLNHFEINLQSISDVLGRYKNGYYEPIVSNLQELTKVQVLTNILHKNKTQESVLFHFIRKISWLKDKQTTSKRVKVWIEPELLSMFLNLKDYYSKMYLPIQLGLKSKYSKLLYEVLKDYSGMKEITFDFEVLKAMLNVDVKEKPSLDLWSNFNRDVLKKAVKEVSEKSDLFVTYEPVKETVEGKMQVTKIKFKMKKQKSILVDEDEYETIELDTHIVSDDDVETKELTKEDIKYIEMAQSKMESAKMFGTQIKNEQAYLEKIIEGLKKEKIDVKNMILIDDFINELRQAYEEYRNQKNQLLVLQNYQDYPVVSINKDYKLYSPADNLIITKSVEETINKINEFKKDGGKFSLIETPSKIQELEISYL